MVPAFGSDGSSVKEFFCLSSLPLHREVRFRFWLGFLKTVVVVLVPGSVPGKTVLAVLVSGSGSWAILLWCTL